MNIHATGDNIKHLCKRKGLTLGILADRIGVSDCTMSNWVNGRRQITAYELLRVSRVLGVTMEELMEGVEDEKYLPKEEPDITGDAISRSSLLAKYDKEHEGPPGRARKLIEEEPPVHTEIIYCKDCGHRDDHGCCKYWRGLAMGEIPIATDDYDFCNHARRREREH